MSDGSKHWSITTALDQIQKCCFECEGGPLANNVGWQWLVEAAKVGPEFMPGQGVWFLIDATAAGKTLTQWCHFYIVGCSMESDTEGRYWTYSLSYSLSYDPPAPWHYGTVHFKGIRAEKLFLEKVELEQAA